MVTIPYIQQKFDDFNRQYFGNLLPPIPIKLSNAKTFLGKVCYRKERGLLNFWGRGRLARGCPASNEKWGTSCGKENHWHYSDFVLRINTRIDLPEEVVEDTILHEMIHYYIVVNQLQDTSAHGRLFRAEMARLNALGRHIRISHRLTPEQAKQAQGKRKTRVVCVAYFKDGRVGVKVVPKQVAHVLRFHRAAFVHFPIDHLCWYLSDSPFFAQYPSSSALRFYLCPNTNTENTETVKTTEPTEPTKTTQSTQPTPLQAALQQSRPLFCDGTTLRLSPTTSNTHLHW